MIKRAAKGINAVLSDYGVLILLMWLFEFRIESAALVFLALRVLDLAEYQLRVNERKEKGHA